MMAGRDAWERGCRIIHAMDVVARSFNDEDYVAVWLSEGVPDGCRTLDDVKDMYPDDGEFGERAEEIGRLFCRLVARQVARVRVGEGVPREKVDISYDADGVVSIG